MAAKDIVARLRQFDAYPKTLDDFRIKTFGGATGKHKSVVTGDSAHN